MTHDLQPTSQQALDWLRRSGTKLVYQGEPGESITIQADGSAIVVHPDKPPRRIWSCGASEAMKAY